MIATADLVFRFGAIAIGLVLAWKYAAKADHSNRARFALLGIFSGIVLIICTSLSVADLALKLPALALTTKAGTIICLAVFFIAIQGLNDPKIKPEGWLVVFAVLHFVLGKFWLADPAFEFAFMTFVLIGIGYFQIWTLNQSTNRKTRNQIISNKWVVLCLTSSGILQFGTRLFFGFFAVPDLLFLAEAFIIFLEVFVIANWSPTVRGLYRPSDEVEDQLVHLKRSSIEEELLVKLQTAAGQGVLNQQNLTIGKLAKILETPEYRLRRLINQGMGYRNFAMFLNHNRIGQAQRRLADHRNSRVSITSMAYDLGYGAPGPFNRAFREIVGISPSEFRKQNAGTRS